MSPYAPNPLPASNGLFQAWFSDGIREGERSRTSDRGELVEGIGSRSTSSAGVTDQSSRDGSRSWCISACSCVERVNGHKCHTRMEPFPRVEIPDRHPLVQSIQESPYSLPAKIQVFVCSWGMKVFSWNPFDPHLFGGINAVLLSDVFRETLGAVRAPPSPSSTAGRLDRLRQRRDNLKQVRHNAEISHFKDGSVPVLVYGDNRPR
jgi:hypothetical protein